MNKKILLRGDGEGSKFDQAVDKDLPQIDLLILQLKALNELIHDEKSDHSGQITDKSV